MSRTMNSTHSIRFAAALGLLSVSLSFPGSARADGPVANPPPPTNGAAPAPTGTLQPPANTPPPTGTLQPPATPPPTGTLQPPATPPPTGTLQPPATPPPTGNFQPPALGAPVPVGYPGPAGGGVSVGPQAPDPLASYRARAPGVEQWHSRRRYLIGGGITLGVAYYLALVGSSFGFTRNNRGSKDYFAGFVPVVGPFVTGVMRAVPERGQAEDWAGMTAYFAIGAVQALGAGLLFKGWRMAPGIPYDPCVDSDGLASDAPRRRPCSRFTATVEPIMTPTFAGAGLTGTF